MKTSIYLLLSLFLVNCNTSINPNPDFTLFPEELIKINDYGINEFDTYVSAKKYFLENVTHESGFDIYTYTVKQNDPTKYYSIHRVVNAKKEPKLISFMKAGNENYSTLKQSIEKLGFKFYSTQEIQNSTSLVFIKDELMIKLTPAQDAKGLTIFKVINVRVAPIELNSR
jgi:hypothetical protein